MAIDNKKAPVHETIPDRIVRYFNPVKALQRSRARAFMSLNESFFAASRTRPGTRNLVANSYDADSAMRYEIIEARNRSSHVIRNIPLASGAIGTTVTNVVGSGLVMQSRIDADVIGISEKEAEKWQTDVEFKFRLHMESKDSDLSRTHNGYERQELVFRSALERGDSFVIRRAGTTKGYPYNLRTQIVEADRVCNDGDAQDSETLSYGIQRDTNGAPEEVHILRSHPGSTINRGSRVWDRVPVFGPKTGRRQVLHVCRPLRPGQSRGLPFLTPVIETLIQLGKYTEAEIHAAVVAGMFTVFVKSEDGDGAGGIVKTDSSGNAIVETKSTGDPDKLGYGSVWDLRPGESIETANPTRPNGNFDPFVLAFCRWIGVALEIPYEILIKHFTASYSASRAALQEAWKFFKGRREWLAANYCQPEYEWWLDEMVSRGIVAAPGYFEDPFIRQAYLGAMWIGPAKGMIQENIEVEAAGKRIELGLSTIAEETAQLTGGDFLTNHVQRVKEAKMRRRDGLDVESVAERIRTEPQQPEPAKPDPKQDKKEDETEDNT